jgi:hypothetical protein
MEPERVKQIQVPINGGPSPNDIDRVMQAIVRMGIKFTSATSPDEGSRPGYKRAGPALILTVPDDMTLGEVRYWVDKALRESKLAGNLSTGEPIALE